MARTAVALRHVAFEDAGSLEPALTAAGYDLTYIEAWRGDFSTAESADLLVVLGGPIGVYETVQYPFLNAEIALIEARLAADRPTIGFCLGAQLMAKALGADVYPGTGKEIGWSLLSLTDEGLRGPLSELDGAAVLHWHGDTFDLPLACDLLASSELYERQGFSRGRNVLGLQFHVEVTAAGLEAWLVGHAGELASVGITPRSLRETAAKAAPVLEARAKRLFERWLQGLA